MQNSVYTLIASVISQKKKRQRDAGICLYFSKSKTINNHCLWVEVLLFILFLTTMFKFSNHVHELFGGGKCQKEQSERLIIGIFMSLSVFFLLLCMLKRTQLECGTIKNGTITLENSLAVS